jgi:hypothetical protein
MKYILLAVFTALFSMACRPDRKLPHQESTVDKADNKLHGIWKSVMIRTREKQKPKEVELRITTYNNSKLIWLQMIATGPKGSKVDRTIQVVSEEQGGTMYLVPIISKQLEASNKNKDKKFINYSREHQQEAVGLKWQYMLTDGDQLLIRMETSSITFERLQ